MHLLSKLLFAAVAAAVLVVAAPASAQTKLKWAHVYETSEPIAQALQNIHMGPVEMAAWQKMLAPFATVMRAGLTTDPGFISRHFSRNQLVAATFADNENAAITADKQGMQNFAKRLPFGLMFEGMGSMFKKDQAYYDWIKSGASRSAYIELNKNYIDNNVWKLSEESAVTLVAVN